MDGVSIFKPIRNAVRKVVDLSQGVNFACFGLLFVFVRQSEKIRQMSAATQLTVYVDVFYYLKNQQHQI